MGANTQRSYGEIREDGYVFTGYGKKKNGDPREIWRSPESFLEIAKRIRRPEDPEKKRLRNKRARERKKLGIPPKESRRKPIVEILVEKADDFKKSAQQVRLSREAEKLATEAFHAEQMAWRRHARKIEWGISKMPKLSTYYYYKNHADILSKMKEDYYARRDYYREYSKRIYSTPEQKEKRRQYGTAWKRKAAQNPDYRKKCREKLMRWKVANPEKIKEINARARRKPINKIKKNLRNRIKELCRGLVGKSKLIGCTTSFLRDHIQSQFKEGMSWDNYGSVWHIDHIKPIASFDISDPTQRALANNWSNLRPMFAIENMAKADKLLSYAELGGNLFGWAV